LIGAEAKSSKPLLQAPFVAQDAPDGVHILRLDAITVPTVLDLVRRISKQTPMRFVETSVHADDLAKAGKFLCDLATLKAEISRSAEEHSTDDQV
jgi:hypothetical protein